MSFQFSKLATTIDRDRFISTCAYRMQWHENMCIISMNSLAVCCYYSYIFAKDPGNNKLMKMLCFDTIVLCNRAIGL